MKFWGLVIVILGLALITPKPQAQIVSLPIPGSPLTLNVQANPQPLQNLNTNPAATPHNLGDDGWVNVPLPFPFPFYGQTFDMSTMYSNGAVQFGRPVPVGAWPNWNGSFCCSGIRLNANTPEGYYYSILALQTDIAGWLGNQHFSLGTTNSMTYGWYNVEQFGNPNARSSFEIKIDNTGGIDMRWSGALITNTPVTIGTIGDASKGQFTQNYHGNGINMPSPVQLSTGIDLCVINPLSSPSCSGYAEAYKTQQCSVNPLYDPACPGYQQAYFSQQCTANPLFNQNCLGYQEAYFTQQCTADPLYNSGCSGYQQAYFSQQCSLSALYSSNCPGYQEAYLSFRCNQDSLYSSQCPGYQQAYFTQQCTANPLYNSQCPGYGQAYFNQQCSINPLYNSNCGGYSQAFKAQQCTLNPLYASDCPGYQQAYFNQQCSLNTLYDLACPGYAAAFQAYQTAQACRANSQSSPTCPGYVTPVVNNITPVPLATASTSTSSTTPPLVADPVVNQTVTATSTATAPTAPAAPIQLTPTTTSTQQTTTALVVESVQSQSSTSSSSSTSNASSSTSASSATSSSTTPTARQSLQQARVEAARKQAVAKGAEAVKESGEARSMEQQTATQGLIVAAMGFNPAFDAYNSVVMKDASFYRPFTIYSGQRTVDNRSASRGLFGSTDRLHNQMVDQQYQLGR